MKKYLLFLESISKINELEFVGPRAYYDILEIAATDNGKVVAYSHYTNDDTKDYWFTKLLWINKDYRNEKYPLLALNLILLTCIATGKMKILFDEMSVSGEAFLRKFQKEGYWRINFKTKEIRLTKKGISFAEKLSKEHNFTY